MSLQPYTAEWQVGLTIRRQAAGAELSALVLALEQQAVRYPGVDTRAVTPEAQNHSVGITLLNAGETRTRSSDLGIVSVEEAEGSLLAQVPALEQPMDLDVTGVRLQRSRRGPKFIIVDVSERSTQRIQQQRKDVTKHLDKLRQYNGRYDWLTHILDLTVAFLPGDSHPEAIRNMEVVAKENTPSVVTLMPALFVRGRL